MAVDESVKKISINYGNLGDVASTAVPAITSNIFGDIGGDSEWGRGLGTLFSLGSSAALGRMSSNLFKGNTLMEGVGHDALSSMSGAGVGLASYGIGQGINALGGDSKLSRGIGAGVSTGLGTLGGSLASTGKLTFGGTGLFSNVGANVINPYALGASVLGSALGAAMGPSKEYGGKYGNVTRTMDTIYDTAMAAVNFVPGIGLGISAAMALNKGLSNLFGSTSGMTKQDAILGSAFMPAPVKWLNMAGARTTNTFNNLSWLNTEKANSFMQNAFGNLNNKFDKAREEAGKTYGTFSNGAYKKALRNIEFANQAWNKILSMADLNLLQTIRSLYMTSINNLRYALDIQGGWNPLARGKYGMKILNNATNHNMGMRLLSGAALIDDKQMIISALGGIKVIRPRTKSHGSTSETKPSYMTEEEWEERQRAIEKFNEYKKSRGISTNKEAKPYTEGEKLQQAAWNVQKEKELAERQARIDRRYETNARHAALYSNLAANVADTVQQNTLFEPVTLESLQSSNTELLKQEQLADKNEYFDNGMKFLNAATVADLGVNIAPLLLIGFRWAFNRAGLLVRVPIQRTNLFLTSPYTGKWTLFGNREYRFKPGYAAMNGSPIESRVYNSKLMDTINKFWENIGKNKVRVQGEKTSGILTKPGTAPETFNGQNIQYISSPNGLPVVNKFYTEQGSEYILTKDGFARRIKSPHSNTGGSDSGLHDWNTGHTVFTEGKEGELFNMATLFLHERGKKIAIGNSNGKLQLWIIGENGQWRPALKSDAYPQAVKLGIMLDGELVSSYSKEPVIGNHILEYDMNSSGIITGSHPGSPVSFIE